MAFTIEADNDKREDFAEYRYRIHRDGTLVANYWCDFRGDDHGIHFLDGTSAGWPVGSVTAFIQGGGSGPLRLTEAAVAFLEEHVPAGSNKGTPPPQIERVVAAVTTRPGRNRRLAVAAALVLWLACLFLPPLTIADRDSGNLGIAYLFTGWMGPLAMHFEWFANPLFFIASFALWRGHAKSAFVLALIACLLVMLLPIGGTIYADEGGHRQPILAFRLGFWLWFAAPAIVLLGAMANLRPTPPPLPGVALRFHYHGKE
jgi:hypothetical protein